MQTIRLPREVALETTYLNDVRLDLVAAREDGVHHRLEHRGAERPGVVDLAAERGLAEAHGPPAVRAEAGFAAVTKGEGHDGLKMEADGIAISAEGSAAVLLRAG